MTEPARCSAPALQDHEGRLFKPLAYTKSFSMFFGALLSLPVAPFHPIIRFLIWIYRPIAEVALRWRYLTVLIGLIPMVAIVPIYASLGSEFMPPLWEEALLFRPATLPGASIQTMKYGPRYAQRLCCPHGYRCPSEDAAPAD